MTMPVSTNSSEIKIDNSDTLNDAVSKNAENSQPVGDFNGRKVINTKERLNKIQSEIHSHNLKKQGMRMLAIVACITGIAIIITAAILFPSFPLISLGATLTLTGVAYGIMASLKMKSTRMVDNEKFIAWAEQKNLVLNFYNIDKHYTNFILIQKFYPDPN
ncbi:MAG TPA: hypothetical protein VGP47_02920 [Parachlamydiaceae bacterium]|nr:hypothetical protein [Parachlamydiaceae bacterium]